METRRLDARHQALQLFDDTTCVLRAALRWAEFYQHESCGGYLRAAKTPCWAGSSRPRQLEDGTGTDEDLDTILDVGNNIMGRAFCALGDAVPVPISSAIKYFRDEIIQHGGEAAARSTRPPRPRGRCDPNDRSAGDRHGDRHHRRL